MSTEPSGASANDPPETTPEVESLYLVQDYDRPCYVIAKSWQGALDKWKHKMAQENDCEANEVDEPNGIQLLAEGIDLIN